ncbi:ABC transporter ATP-binding protein [Haloarcula sp. S1CR25-12]|uniref:ABC transporter ATP-binding protein n=1 Tax=Haloarcula saliterrae TaxID=2950534 RepID=A0ABU2F7S7_9EURY|nr:ABC transporter ATP-binding protein [Haloarcula sp. S1CR25-12]MDS0258289.1 ABC transporter ATP-binding protein [Haloarcula sp. S1CR25-12]
MSTLDGDLRGLVPEGRSLALWAVVLNTELLAVMLYLLLLPGAATDPVLLGFPFVWLNVAGWVLLRVRAAPASARRRAVAAAVAVGYGLVLGYVGGVVGLGGTGGGLRVVLAAPPGFAPSFVYSGSSLAVVVTPWKVAGYLALSYLVYVTVVDASGGVAGGLLGLFSCVSCVLPIVASVVGGFAGVGATLYQAALYQSYGLSTAVFLASVGLLYAVHRFDVTLVGWLRS